MHEHEAARHVQQDKNTVAPLKHRERRVPKAAVERAAVHVLENEAAVRPIEGDGEQLVDMRMPDLGQVLDLGLDLHVILTGGHRQEENLIKARIHGTVALTQTPPVSLKTLMATG